MAFCGGAALGHAAAALPSGPAGYWLTANHQAVVAIAVCGQGLCGRIAGMAEAPGGAAPLDWRGKTQCGETIIQMQPDADNPGHWRGTVLDPRDGSVWNATLALGVDQTLRLRGYVLLPALGETQTWTQYKGTPPVGCRFSAA